jgi:cytochrome d ubiquinol oxidase subunit II
MLVLIIIILGSSFVLYTLLGGADFGAGIIETFAGKRGQKTISKAIAPVWEANHVWLILAIVILFTGFPEVYSSLSLVLHIPLMIVLIGIILRGSAFTFRQYDVIKDRSHNYFTILFKASSIITPLFLGVILGAMILGKITFDPAAGFYRKFIYPWLNMFCFSLGIFSTCLFSYIAAAFLIGETDNESEKLKYKRLTKRAMFLTFFIGIIVFAVAESNNYHLFQAFLNSKISITALLIASVLISVILKLVKHTTKFYLRAAVALQVSMIIIGWFAIQYPVLINVSSGEPLTFINTQAPYNTLLQLLIALLTGLILIIPAFVYLFRVFKMNP